MKSVLITSYSYVCPHTILDRLGLYDYPYKQYRALPSGFNLLPLIPSKFRLQGCTQHPKITLHGDLFMYSIIPACLPCTYVFATNAGHRERTNGLFAARIGRSRYNCCLPHPIDLNVDIISCPYMCLHALELSIQLRSIAGHNFFETSVLYMSGPFRVVFNFFSIVIL